MKLLAWDLETSNLSASFGTIICAGYKVVGEGDAEVIDISQYKGNPLQAEKRMLRDLSDILMDSDAWLTWFGTYFDVPYVNTRLLYHHLPVLPASHPHIDGWKTAKNRLRLGNNRLNTVQSFLGLKDEKTHIKGEHWILALAGVKESMDYLVEHCYQDVLVLEEAYERLRPLIVDHPNSNVVHDIEEGCPTCGEDSLQKRGFHLTRTRRYQRFQCTSCGAWSKASKPNRIAKVA